MSARKLQLILAPDARTDFADILLYTRRQWGQRQRAAYKTVIDRALRELTGFPNLGRARDEISPGLRRFSAGSQVIYYRVSDKALIVTRIVHSRRDFEDGSTLG
jgi:toxin ParE1/3/4